MQQINKSAFTVKDCYNRPRKPITKTLTIDN